MELHIHGQLLPRPGFFLAGLINRGSDGYFLEKPTESWPISLATELSTLSGTWLDDVGRPVSSGRH
jgi:hypothetical protein